MGGCCCGSSRGVVVNTAARYYCPSATEERVPLSSQHRTLSTISSGVIVDTNLDTSSLDAYKPPPPPIPFNAPLGHPQTPQRAHEISIVKRDGPLETTNSDSPQVTLGNNAMVAPALCEIKEFKGKALTDFDLDSAQKIEPEVSKEIENVFPPAGDDDGCPICLEDYNTENPKLMTKCEHHFHLACILEWMERSETCPVCDKEVAFDPPIDY